MLIGTLVVLFVAVCISLSMVIYLWHENAWLDLRCNNLRKDVLRQGVTIDALEKDIDSMEDRIFKLEDKISPQIEGFDRIMLTDEAYTSCLAVGNQWAAENSPEISSTLDRQSGCSAE